MVCLDEGGRGRHSIRLVAAPANLADWVEHFFVQAGSPAERGAWRIVPDACPHIIFSAVEGKPRCQVIGSRASYCDIDTSRRRVTVGVRLRPGGLLHLVRGSAVSFTDTSIPAADVFGAAGRELTGRMAESTPAAALRLLARFLAARLDACPPDHRLERALRTAPSVAAASALLNVPERTLRAQTLRLAGLSPKRILRIRRLYRALRFDAVRRTPWSDVASRAGYADQAHMVREFRALVGDSPEAWRGRAADSFNTPAGGTR